ncbi:uncharacterized protein LOC119553576 [Drosophila subpulchrella]|uniref:uncharacterized protein LOC119553576 n=1 Tax=Drosophila subpulchrella TaxID=1486046 RepID=UPI0018A19954|nr:uncharacterized protein LOC119553576 [Drosophila subpulchrella]
MSWQIQSLLISRIVCTLRTTLWSLILIFVFSYFLEKHLKPKFAKLYNNYLPNFCLPNDFSDISCKTMTSFHIKLLSDKNVVLVEAPGHESEIFLPEIHLNNIVLENIIRSRRPLPKRSDVCVESTQGQVKGQIIRRPQIQPRLTTATAGLAPWDASIDGGPFTRAADEESSPQQFSLKLISNGSEVLVECNVLESEIFIPKFCGQYIAMKRTTGHRLQSSRLRSKSHILAIQPPKGDPLRLNPKHFFAKAKFNIQVENSVKSRKKMQKKRLKREHPNNSGAGDQKFGKFLK